MRLIIIKDDIVVMSKIYDNKLIASFSDIAKVHGTTKTRLWKEFKRIKRNVLPFNEVEDYHIIDSYDAKTIGIFENLFPKGYKYNTQTVLTEKGYLKLAKVLMLDKEMTETYIKKYFRNRELLQENTGSNNLENIQKEQTWTQINENIKRRDNNMNSNLITIADKEIELKEYNGERVVTSWDIADLHEKDVKVVNQHFNRNITNLIENEDYYIISKETFLKSHFVTLKNHAPNLKEVALFTESGYLLLVKGFTDERSWNIQRQLVKSYFKNDTAMSNTFRYYPDEIIPKLYDLIMDKKKKRYTKYGLSKPYHELHDMEIDDEDF